MKKKPLVKKRDASPIDIFNATVLEMQRQGIKDADKIPFVVDPKSKTKEDNDGGTD